MSLLNRSVSRQKGFHAGHEGQAISVENIVKKYGDFEAVKGVTFDVKDGEIFGLLGPNGAGKSTLIRMMTTLIPITSGKAFIAGYDVSENADAARRTMGVIPQAMTSDIDLTIEENMRIYAKLYSVPRAERERNIDELLEAVDLVKWRGAQVKTLSGGMRRRAEIARGLVHNPRIFFLDEPTTGLDPVSRVAVWEMLNTLKSRRQLTILITTHYMDEADRLCDRIAIVDHGNLVALDSPMALKTNVPGNNVVEAQFVNPPPGWVEQLRALPGVESVHDEGGNMFRMLTSTGSQTTTGLVELAVRAGAEIKTLSVQNTSLDDVFVHYTGRQLRDEQVKAFGYVMPDRPGDAAMNRMFAIIEREMRKFFRSPTLMVTAMIFPLVQLIILGNAFGGKIRDARIAIVDEDHGPQATRIIEAFHSVEANIRTFVAVPYTDEVRAREDVRQGRLEGALIIPPQFSRRFYAGENPQLGMVVDNSDQFMSSSIEDEMQLLVNSLNLPDATAQRITTSVALEIIELYPYIEYMKYLLPGAITLAMFVSVMIGGGMLYIDDKARGVHEGYLVTPITRLEMVLGLNIAGAIKAILAGVTLVILGSLIAGLGSSFQPMRIAQWFLLVCATSFAFNGMMFLLMVRVEDPLVPRAMFGILNTLLYFPSGAIYPVQAFPKWLRYISYVDPFSYAVHGLKATLLKEASWAAVSQDLLYLALFGLITLGLSVPLFKRTL